jgi:hypothetical protein
MYNLTYDLKVGSLVRWWGDETSGNSQDVDDIGLVTKEEDWGVDIWWSVTKLENAFEWPEIEESLFQQKLEIISV